MGVYLLEKAKKLKEKFDCIVDVRGIGLMVGIQLSVEGKAIVDHCFNNGLIINCTQGKILRLMPALTVTKKQIDRAFHTIEKAFEENVK